MWVNIQRITRAPHCANVVWPDLDHTLCTDVSQTVMKEDTSLISLLQMKLLLERLEDIILGSDERLWVSSA